MGQKRVFLLLAGSLFAVSLLAVSLMLSRVVHREACAAPIQRKDVPKNVEGIEIIGNQIKLKSGYEFVMRSENKVAIARRATGGVAFEVNCECSKAGSCKFTTPDTGTLKCETVQNGCGTGVCELTYPGIQLKRKPGILD